MGECTASFYARAPIANRVRHALFTRDLRILTRC